ncbi:MAG TPA: UDP-N-acetylglucosamine 1-carboxyvinyltransferase [bacterium]|nr:UDP-N-acetylglucosamine 1-carboxyvinyltransferase [bacterium]HOA18413.1 UDP-N-acetylglucosamine 1-carboxyvinyltransferase [bacterium]
MQIIVEGASPLVGSVKISGAKNSALKLLSLALHSNEDSVIDNVPHIDNLISDIEIIKSVGGTVEWLGSNRLMVNGSKMNSYEIPYDIGSGQRTCILLAGPLLFRFGKAIIPKFRRTGYSSNPINRHIDMWKSLGINIEEDSKYVYLSSEKISSGTINFKIPSHMATDNAVLSSIFIQGETVINNASEESEVDDLLAASCLMGADVRRTDPKTILVNGNNILKGFKYSIQGDKTEAATLAAAAILTRGNIEIKGIEKSVFIPFANFLTKIGARFEFTDNGVKVWRHDESINSSQVNISPTPGFIPDWQPLAVLILNQAEGVSYVHDTVYTDRFEYIKDLNRMGAEIELIKPSSINNLPIVSDDSYNIKEEGEPLSVAKITGPKKLRGERLQILDFKNGAVLLLAALSAEGKSEIIGVENIEEYFESFLTKIKSLGAKIWQQ